METKSKVDIESFEFLGLIGQGAYGNVYMAKKKSTGKLYAIKRLCKRKLQQEGKQYQVFRERQALILLDHPNVIKMYWTFDVITFFLNKYQKQDKKYLYFVLDLADNGELYNLIRRERKLQLDLVKFYTAEVVTILEYLRSKGVAHRDLKPSNLLLD